MRQIYKIVTFAAVILAAAACQHRTLYTNCPGEVVIPVVIDWSISGIIPGTRVETDYVHRVSLRFFPKDGSAPFQRYLEGNVFEGNIEVPLGNYSVIVYNESYSDIYWDGFVKFTDADDYNLFSASIVETNFSSFDFYTPNTGEIFAIEPLKLASWSLDNFEVTKEMQSCLSCRSDPDNMINALKKVVMRPLVTSTNVVVEVTNLKSAMRIEAAFAGVSGKIYMASAVREAAPSTHFFTFTSPVWDDGAQQHGSVSRRFLTFGRMPQLSIYTLDLGVMFITGERYIPEQPLRYDVSEQVTIQSDGDINILIRLILPIVNDGIHIGDWDDEEHIIQ